MPRLLHLEAVGLNDLVVAWLHYLNILRLLLRLHHHLLSGDELVGVSLNLDGFSQLNWVSKFEVS